MAGASASSDDLYVLITGANSGVGFAICCRLIDEFLLTRSPSSSLHLTITTRSSSKSSLTLSRLRTHNPSSSNRVTLTAATLDLTSLVSVRTAAAHLSAQLQRLDVVILNAGIGGWTGLDWPRAVWAVCTDLVYATTWPDFNKSAIGQATAPQEIAAVGTDEKEVPAVGEVFCANVLGHYMLVHYLAPLLRRACGVPAARIIWQGSVSVYASGFAVSDIQGLRAADPYDSSKRLTDILALTATLPSNARWVQDWLCLGEAEQQDQQREARDIKSYVCHPGICSTSIMPLAYILTVFMAMSLYAARWLGSIWHPITAYKGAVSAVWLSLSAQDTLDRMEEQGGGPGKWGSATDQWGSERVERTEVEGWGWGGVVETDDGRRYRGRRRGAKELTGDEREEFEVLGQECWREMEELRKDWEKRLC